MEEHDFYLCQAAAEGRMSKPCRGEWGVGRQKAACPCRCHSPLSPSDRLIPLFCKDGRVHVFAEGEPGQPLPLPFCGADVEPLPQGDQPPDGVDPDRVCEACAVHALRGLEARGLL